MTNAVPNLDEAQSLIEKDSQMSINQGSVTQKIQMHPEARPALISAMTDYVLAQHDYVHTKEVGPMIQAQKAFLHELSLFVAEIELGYVAEANELAINCLLSAIREHGKI
jgi:uncharacterized tellurite resistance protein B-like protein